MTESDLRNKTKKMLKTEFPEVWAQKISDRFTSGILDWHLCVNGIFCALEAKTPQNNKRDPLQEYTIRAIRAAGGVAGIYRNLEEARQLILEARGKGGDINENNDNKTK